LLGKRNAFESLVKNMELPLNLASDNEIEDLDFNNEHHRPNRTYGVHIPISQIF
jgi:hypothetical protein